MKIYKIFLKGIKYKKSNRIPSYEEYLNEFAKRIIIKEIK